MYGAVIGDLAGSIYEYDQLKKIKPIKMDKVIPDNAFYSASAFPETENLSM